MPQRSSSQRQSQAPDIEWDLGYCPLSERAFREEHCLGVSQYLDQCWSVLHGKHSFAILRSNENMFACIVGNNMKGAREISDSQEDRRGPIVVQTCDDSAGKSPPSWIQTLAGIRDGLITQREGNDPEDHYRGWVNEFEVRITCNEWNYLRNLLDLFQAGMDGDLRREIKARRAEQAENKKHMDWIAQAKRFDDAVEQSCKVLEDMIGGRKRAPTPTENHAPNLHNEPPETKTAIANRHSDELPFEGPSQIHPNGLPLPGVPIENTNRLPIGIETKEKDDHGSSREGSKSSQDSMDGVVSTGDVATRDAQDAPSEEGPVNENVTSRYQPHLSKPSSPQPLTKTPNIASATISSVLEPAAPDDTHFVVPELPRRILNARTSRGKTPISNNTTPFQRSPEEREFGFDFLSDLKNRGYRFKDMTSLYKGRFGIWRSGPALSNYWREVEMEPRDAVPNRPSVFPPSRDFRYNGRYILTGYATENHQNKYQVGKKPDSLAASSEQFDGA
ncbi:hypothetical protein N7456_010487 [Penicillium angulare]|uniref:Uncharacterized protein n=1 Tax=Penicillium angulare TaxID=116970 RepID=A0A9W9F6P2_9EURO|nr:hypothetical protein N7456_010487 [Penicillium angulare]